MTYDRDFELEAEARALFEADPYSSMETDWDYLAPYKRADWTRIALLKRERRDRLDLGGMQLIRTAQGNVVITSLTIQQSVALQAADLPDIIKFLLDTDSQTT